MPVNDTQFGLNRPSMNSGGLIMGLSAGNSGVQAESISDIHCCSLIKQTLWLFFQTHWVDEKTFLILQNE